ncbi:hypothetical protein Tco_0460897 [Tanacetum coccineum]
MSLDHVGFATVKCTTCGLDLDPKDFDDYLKIHIRDVVAEAEAREKAAAEKIRHKNLEEARARRDMKKKIPKNEHIQPKTGSSGTGDKEIHVELKDIQYKKLKGKKEQSGEAVVWVVKQRRQLMVNLKKLAHAKNSESEAVVWELMDLGKSSGKGSSSESEAISGLPYDILVEGKDKPGIYRGQINFSGKEGLILYNQGSLSWLFIRLRSIITSKNTHLDANGGLDTLLGSWLCGPLVKISRKDTYTRVALIPLVTPCPLRLQNYPLCLLAHGVALWPSWEDFLACNCLYNNRINPQIPEQAPQISTTLVFQSSEEEPLVKKLMFIAPDFTIPSPTPHSKHQSLSTTYTLNNSQQVFSAQVPLSFLQLLSKLLVMKEKGTNTKGDTLKHLMPFIEQGRSTPKIQNLQ